MTYSIPYSFVPGTKAKADEVNANFIDVLQKIENTNSRIQEEEERNSTNLLKKADKEEIDGEWICKYIRLAQECSLTGSTALTFSINSYLPEDDNLYEVIVRVLAETAGNNGDYIPVYVSSDWSNGNVFSICACRARASGKVTAVGTVNVLVGTDRNLIFSRATSYAGDVNISLLGYRKVR